jgi:cytochrome c biogenesis protein CcmG/thiol:disulfide interchange protein DsbE
MAVLAVVGLLAYGVISKGTARVAAGEPIPERTLPKLDGPGTGSVADYRGHWTLVNVWASWCEPCREEAPALQGFYDAEWKHGLVVLGIDSRDLSGDARAFAGHYGLTYPQLHDGPGDVVHDLGMTGFPESFLVDPKGKIALVRPGPVTAEYLQQSVKPFLTGKASS